MEKVLDHGDGDMIEMLLREGIKHRDKYCFVDAGQATTFSLILSLLVIQITPTTELWLILIGRLKLMSFSLLLTRKIRKGALRTTWGLFFCGILPSKTGLSSIASANQLSLQLLSTLFQVPLLLEAATTARFWCGISEPSRCRCKDQAFQPTPTNIQFVACLSSEHKLPTTLSPFPTMACSACGTLNSSTSQPKWADLVLCVRWDSQLRPRLL